MNGGIYRVCIAGNTGCGKTTLLHSIKGDDFHIDYNATIGVDLWIRKTGNGNMQLWDTAGHRKFMSIVQVYFKRCNMVLLCCDLTDKQSYDDLTMWKRTVDLNCVNKYKLVLVGLKSDRTSARVVTNEMMAEASKELDAEAYFEISSMTKSGMSNLMSYLSEIPSSEYEVSNVVKVSEKKPHPPSKCCDI